MSEHLSGAGVAYLVLERGRIAERWRSARWDSTPLAQTVAASFTGPTSTGGVQT
jgi:cation diffusion facilitator CzcD-associated flavoprotein CzcO